jgi:hypothetical protein
VPIVLKSGSLNLLETSGPVKACHRIALPLPLYCNIIFPSTFKSFKSPGGFTSWSAWSLEVFAAVWLTNPFLGDVSRITGQSVPGFSEVKDYFHLQRSRVLTHRLLKFNSLDFGNWLPCDVTSRTSRTESSATKVWPFILVVLTTQHTFLNVIKSRLSMYLLEFSVFALYILCEFLIYCIYGDAVGWGKALQFGGSFKFFQWYNPSCRKMAVGVTNKMSSRCVELAI